MTLNIIQTKVIEVPGSVSLQDKIAILNMWLTELQLEGNNILSTKEIRDNAFLVEYRSNN